MLGIDQMSSAWSRYDIELRCYSRNMLNLFCPGADLQIAEA